MDSPYIDVSALPVIVATFPGEGTVDDIKVYYKDLHTLLKTHRRLAFLVDMSALNLSKATADLRRAMAEEFKPIKPAFDRVAIAEARVVRSKLAQGVLTAFFWIVGEEVACPTKFFADRKPATAWLRLKLTEAGL